jgi:GNAT superfamily N-acetyltransferase
MRVEAAGAEDVGAFLRLAAEVEPWFGAMVGEAGFHAALSRNIGRGSAFVVRAEDAVVGGLLTGGEHPRYRIGWLVVAATARRGGIGRALVGHVAAGWRRPCRVDVVTFDRGHPSGAAAFYERLGFERGAPTEHGTRRMYHLTLDA